MTYVEGNDPITILDEQQIWEFLGTQSLGRIVVRRKDDMDIFPVNYVVSEGAVYFRTGEGNKLFSLALNADVLFEVDHVAGEEAWSVVLKGDAATVTDFYEIQRADELPLKPWVPTLKYNWVRVSPKTMSGRHFDLGDEPERY